MRHATMPPPEVVPDRKPQGGRWLLWLPLLLAGAVLYVINVCSEVAYRSPLPVSLVPESSADHNVFSGFVVDMPGCRIPDLDPFDPAVRPFLQEPSPVRCDARGRQLVASNLTSVYVVRDALGDYNVSSVDQLGCCYRPLWRGKRDNDVRMSPTCTPFHESATIAVEFVKVQCTVDGVLVYRDYHAFVPLKESVEARCRQAQTEGGPSVLVLGIDAVSRLNLHRQMPRTVDALRRLGAVEMLGYNKVADNTFPNLIPALAGMSEQELRHKCWPSDSTPFDACPFVWEAFRGRGYRTAFGEDAPWMGMFSYLKAGFKQQPTDYYLRPLAKASDDDVGHSKALNAKLCVGGVLAVAALLDYVAKFATSMLGRPSLGVFWGASLSHDYLNYPRLGDDTHERLLMRLHSEGVLEDTVLIVMSDHGIRWGAIRETYQGRLEERLPFLFFVFPKKFADRYPTAVANVRRNARRLSSPFDLHETLADLADVESTLGQQRLRERSLRTPSRGISLFVQIPGTRTCPEAGIDSHWCTCQRSERVSVNNDMVNRSAYHVVQHVNRLLAPFRQCSSLQLAAIQDAQIQLPVQQLANNTRDGGFTDYLVVVRTQPGHALLEATVRYRMANNSIGVVGVVSRLNAYGRQSVCVGDYHLKLYCYCS